MSLQIFMGNGQISQAKCFELINDLMNAFEYLTAIQQPPDPTEKLTDEQDEDEERYVDELNDLINSIAIKLAESLTGKKVILKEIKK